MKKHNNLLVSGKKAALLVLLLGVSINSFAQHNPAVYMPAIGGSWSLINDFKDNNKNAEKSKMDEYGGLIGLGVILGSLLLVGALACYTERKKRQDQR